MSVIDERTTSLVLGPEATRAVEEIAKIRDATFEESISEAIGLYRELIQLVNDGATILVAKNNERTQEIVFPKKGS
jgi:hypothetical protein